jgi:hypothetical protein
MGHDPKLLEKDRKKAARKLTRLPPRVNAATLRPAHEASHTSPRSAKVQAQKRKVNGRQKFAVLKHARPKVAPLRLRFRPALLTFLRFFPRRRRLQKVRPAR